MRDAVARRALDVALAGTGLIVSAPLLAILATAVKLDSPGPALFRQVRIGKGQRPIRVTKLRTMRFASVGPTVTSAADPRITRIGAFLRRTKLDELPQLWDVLRGDMSIVGPRPEVPGYVARYRPEWQKLFTVRPGITDIASLTFRDEEGLLALAKDRERAYVEIVMPLKLELALAGVERSSILHDLQVIVRTAIAIVHRAPTDPIIAKAQQQIKDLGNG